MGSIKQPVAVFGRGWLGKLIAQYFQVPVSDADITDRRAVARALAGIGGGVAINAAAKTGGDTIDGCDATPQTKADAFRVNAVGPMYLADECRLADVRLVQLSTTYVFAETPPVDGGFSEEVWPVLPGAKAYSASKAIVDLMLQQVPGTLILRINLPIDGTPHPRNFITRLVNYAQVQDVRHSLTTVPALLSVMGSLIGRGASGVYHVVHSDTVTNGQLITWYRELVDPMHAATIVPPDAQTRTGIIARPDRLIREGLFGRTEPAVRECLKRYALLRK